MFFLINEISVHINDLEQIFNKNDIKDSLIIDFWLNDEKGFLNIQDINLKNIVVNDLENYLITNFIKRTKEYMIVKSVS